MSSLIETDNASKAVQKTQNRVALSDIENNIDNVEYVNPQSAPQSAPLLTVAVVTLKNGYTIIGKAASADPENHNEEIGRKFAYEDAIRQIWPLMGYALKESLSKA